MQSYIVNASPEVLNSWKEIAAYLNRGVRTVQRWETALNLPVRRPRGKQRSAVVAMRSDIDEWLRSCPMQQLTQSGQNGGPPLAVETIRVLNPRLSNRDLLIESRALRADLNHSRQQISVSIEKLISTVGKMVSGSQEA